MKTPKLGTPSGSGLPAVSSSSWLQYVWAPDYGSEYLCEDGSASTISLFCSLLYVGRTARRSTQQLMRNTALHDCCHHLGDHHPIAVRLGSAYLGYKPPNL